MYTQQSFLTDATAEQKEVKIGGIRINYFVWGHEGPDVVMVHGITSSGLNWWRVGPHLAEWGYRVIAPDMPGHGDSDKPECSYRLDETAHILDAFMTATGVRSPLVLGHSWGGSLALVQATNVDSRIAPRSVVLADPLLRMRVGDLGALRTMLLKLAGHPYPELAAFLTNHFPRWHDYDVLWAAKALEKVSSHALRGMFDNNTPLNLVPRLRALPCPWVLIRADSDRGSILTRDMYPELEEAAAENAGWLFDMPGMGHDVHREDFDGFMMILNTFLEVIDIPIRH